MEKKLYRSRSKKVIAGVAGGLGDYVNIDPVAIRVLLVLITIINGFGLLLYIILWIVIQEEPYDENFKTKSEYMGEQKTNEFTTEENVNYENKIKPESSSKGRVIFGAILIGLGLIFLFERFIPSFDFEVIFSLALVILGLSMVFNFFNKTENVK